MRDSEQDFGFDAAREIDESLRAGKLPEAQVILPDDTEHIVYKGFAAFFGVGSIELPGVLDDELRRRYPDVAIQVTPVSSPAELPLTTGQGVEDLLPGFYYTFDNSRRR